MILPTINGDGSVGEVKMLSLELTIFKAKEAKVVLFQNIEERHANNKEDTHELYALKDMEYHIGEKSSALLRFYVSVNFEAQNKDREEIIKNIVNMHSPWFFTYAERIDREKEVEDGSKS